MMNYPKIVIYNLLTKEGKHIRKATKVIFRKGSIIKQIKFLEKLPKKYALKLAKEV